MVVKWSSSTPLRVILVIKDELEKFCVYSLIIGNIFIYKRILNRIGKNMKFPNVESKTKEFDE